MKLLKLQNSNAAWTSYDDRLNEQFKTLTHFKSGEDFGEPKLSVFFTIDNKVWQALRKKGHLGMLYGVDLSNYLSRNGILNQYSIPSVSDDKRAVKGVKTIHSDLLLESVNMNVIYRGEVLWK